MTPSVRRKKRCPQSWQRSRILVITDIRMPGMTGLELMQKVRQQHISCEFIVVSGYSDFSYAKEAIAYGVAGYCLKPLNPDEAALCLKRVRESLDKRGAVRDFLPTLTIISRKY